MSLSNNTKLIIFNQAVNENIWKYQTPDHLNLVTCQQQENHKKLIKPDHANKKTKTKNAANLKGTTRSPYKFCKCWK